jgi:sarcosine oxidase
MYRRMRRMQSDVIVVGGGVFGLASALELAGRDNTVTLVDRFGSRHPATSSTGASRSIRLAYNEPVYVELARSALVRWAELEQQSGTRILHLTGQVDLGPEPALAALAEAVETTGLGLERRSNSALREVLPELAESAGDGLFHRQAGTVLADAGMQALLQAVRASGVEVLAPQRVTEIEAGRTARVTTETGALEAERVVIAAGPWSGGLLERLGISLPLAPAIAQVTFLNGPSMVDRPGVAEWPEPGNAGIYGHPVPGVGYKIAFDAGSDGWDPEIEEWAPDPDEEHRILEWMASRLPGAPRTVAYSQRHPWTMTADSDWVIDRRGAIVLACGCSGHAFKFGPALGPLVADVADGADPETLFRLDRAGLQGKVSAADAIAR